MSPDPSFMHGRIQGLCYLLDDWVLIVLYIVKSLLVIISPAQGNTRKSTLLGSIDKTVTAGGARLLKNRIT